MKKNIFLALTMFMIFGCDSKQNVSSQDKKQHTEIKSYDCLKNFTDDYSKLLSLDQITSVVKFDKTKIERKSVKGAYGYFLCKWPSDRPDIEMTVSKITVHTPDYNKVKVGYLSFYSEDSKLDVIKSIFDNGYRKLSKEEIDKKMKAIDKLDNEKAREFGKKALLTRSKIISEKIDGIGTSAWYKWNDKTGGELIVLAAYAKFKIEVKISNDNKENKEIAKKLALLALGNC